MVDTIGRIFKQLAITCFGSTQRLFDAFAPGDVRDDASDRVYFCPGVKQWKLLNNACVRTILLERDFLEFHFDAAINHLKVVGSKCSRLHRRKYFIVPPTFDVFLADAESSFEFPVYDQVATLHIL